MMILIIFIINLLGVVLGKIIYDKSYETEALGELLIAFFATIATISGIACLSLIGIKANNREEFNKKQQEYITITQYIKSDKSNSILESTEMLRKIEEYNEYVIKKQNDMTRTIRKYWAEGANWNELKLINLEYTNKVEESE